MNVVVLHLARSGSSMITSIFEAHGFSTDKGERQVMPDGANYFPYERQRLKDYYQKHRVKPQESDSENGAFFTVRNIHGLHELVSEFPEPWVIKLQVNYWPVVADIPAVVVKVRRSAEAIAASVSAKSRVDYDRTLKNVIERGALLDQVPGFDVVSDEIIRGDLSSLEPVFETCGVGLDRELAMSCIDSNKWHYK